MGCGPAAPKPDAGSFSDDAGAALGLPLQADGGGWLFFLNPLTTGSDTDIDGLDVNATGEVYGGGFVEGSVRFTDLAPDGGHRDVGVSATTGKDLLLFKLAATGGVRWLQVIPTTGQEGNGYDLVVDPVDDVVYSSGSFSGSLNLGPPWQLTSACDESGGGKASSYGQSMLLKHDRDGRVVWALQSTSTTSFAGGNEVALDDARNVLQSGTFGAATSCAAGAPALELGGATVPNDGQADAFAAVLDRTNGALLMNPVHVGGAGYQRAQAIDPGTAPGLTPQSLLLGVSYKGPTTLYSRTRAPVTLDTTSDPNDWDFVVAKYDYQGELLWQRSFGSPTVLVAQGTLVQEQLKGVGRDSHGDVLVSGTLTGSVVVDGVTHSPQQLSPGAVSMGFVARLSGADGAVLWFRSFTSQRGINTCCEVAVGPDDRVSLTPQVYGTDLFVSSGQTVPLRAGSGTDKLGVVLRFDSSGAVVDARHLAALQTAGTNSTSSELTVSRTGLVTWTGTLEGGLLPPVSWDSGGRSAEFVARFAE